ncbi:MAG: BrnA antitoxin family protein [Sphingobium phenoxybenzoativorans]
MNNRLSEKRMDFAAPPPLDAELEAELVALEAMDDARIDTSDIAEQGDAFWRDAERGRFYRPVKQSTTVRIDADVLHWLKAKGKGYQTRINAILREAMMRDDNSR